MPGRRSILRSVLSLATILVFGIACVENQCLVHSMLGFDQMIVYGATRPVGIALTDLFEDGAVMGQGTGFLGGHVKGHLARCDHYIYDRVEQQDEELVLGSPCQRSVKIHVGPTVAFPVIPSVGSFVQNPIQLCQVIDGASFCRQPGDLNLKDTSDLADLFIVERRPTCT